MRVLTAITSLRLHMYIVSYILGEISLSQKICSGPRVDGVFLQKSFVRWGYRHDYVIMAFLRVLIVDIRPVRFFSVVWFSVIKSQNVNMALKNWSMYCCVYIVCLLIIVPPLTIVNPWCNSRRDLLCLLFTYFRYSLSCKTSILKS